MFIPIRKVPPLLCGDFSEKNTKMSGVSHAIGMFVLIRKVPPLHCGDFSEKK